MQFYSPSPSSRQNPQGTPALQPHTPSPIHPQNNMGSLQYPQFPQGFPTGTSDTSPSSLTEKDNLHDLLLTEKNLGHGYTLASMEASNIELAQMATNMLHDVQKAQQRLFQCLHREGQYPVEGAPPTQIQQKAQQLSKMKQEFPYSR